MTDTGQVPGEGLPENAGMVEQPGIPAPGAYTFLDPSGHTTEDDDLLLMPGAQGAWSEHPPGVAPAPPVAVPPPAPVVPHQGVHPPAAEAPAAVGDPLTDPLPDPLTAPLDSVALADVLTAPQHQTPPQGLPLDQPAGTPAHGVPTDQPLGTPAHGVPVDQFGGTPAHGLPVDQPTGTPAHGVPLDQPTGTPAHGVLAAPQEQAPQHGYEPGILDTGAHEAAGRDSGSVDLSGVRVPPPAPAPQAARRPLHMGPPVPEAGGVVRSLADRGPAAAPAPAPQPVPVPAPEPLVATAPAPVPVRNPGPPTSGPEYFEIAQDQQLAPQGAEPWAAQPQEPEAPQAPEFPAETVVPQSGQFVQVDGNVPTTPHLAPAPAPESEPAPAPEEPAEAEAPVAVEETAPEAPAEAPEVHAVVPAPREGEPTAEAPQPAPAEEIEAAAPEAEQVPEAVQAPEAEPQPEEQPEPVAEAVAEAPAEPVAVAEEQPAEEQLPEEAPVEAVAEEIPFVPDETPEAPEALPEQAPEAGTETAPEAEAAPQAEVPVEAEEQVAAEEAPVEAVAEQTVAPELPAEAEVSVETELPADADVPADAAPEEQPETAPVAAEEAESAPAPGYDDAEREAVLRVMRERRDIRNGFRSDPIPHEVLLRVLEAAHTAPSVGHSQPWDFVVIRSAETRQTMHELAQRQREAYAKSLPKARAKQFKELKIEAILDTPVNIVVTADPTRGGRHTLGRYTQPQMAPYSSALAVENLWLAARAEGLGVGWVSFFDEREMVRTLGLPEHLEVVAYLCVGYVDEFPEEPELMQAGWSKRRPLAWVVHEETYGRRALPGEEPHDLLQETIANIRPLDAKALGEAWERQKRMTKPAGALGMLEIIAAQLSGLSRVCPPPIPEPAAVAIFAGDHGVHAQGVTPWPQEVTGQMVANFLGGGAVCNAFANQVGAEVCVIDVGVASELPATPGLLPRKVRPGTADFTTGPAMTRDEVLAAIEVGIETARDLVAAGNKALLTGEMGIANTTASAALISVYTGVDPTEVTGRGTGINDETHARKVDVVRRALDLHKPDPADPIGVLSAVGGLEHAALVGLILGAASLRTPVILDGVSTGAAALVARAIAPESLAACIAGHRSAEPGHVAALNKLGLRPLVDLDLRLGEGTGALLALPLVQSAARAMHEVATFDSAGVTEK
ncbi:nicotinate-nucleotide--dimethylbenzimidazole phosphoribosyltransferase [Streptomyces sp. MBT42]|uniref:nicotinate-nucleotide--dimethylbenzimidazole phosphoribosyltransferase n=1 Tax=Streptomyces sp. MBT42 TaxID=1488373 RepID=UPI001E28683D|nr:nicotinate-nucleotide--dimethylbenzimidazole phosphoribosyltransferase [Streptomyces sp. MBT42]MCD2467948.1 nicotinate-nucleotide--dimethylbenzimidazole phosphoribosyltransferase [Streptomyces sp. MBT42]